MADIKAVFLVGTLKRRPALSNTETLAEYLAELLKTEEVQSEIIRLIDYDIKPGVQTRVDNDDWPEIFEKILSADILIFATPVWWDLHSSLIQRVIERLDEVHDEIMKTGKSRLANKVAGVLVTGDSDGAMHIIGSLANFFMALGLTVPPGGTLTVLWDSQAKNSKVTKQELWEYYEKTYLSAARATARNIALFVRLLRQHPLPESLKL
jgi:multimeric flavodoxin WrbA